MKDFNEFKKEVKPGTTTAKMFFSGLFLVIAILFVIMGFWKTLFVAAMAALGYFIGATPDMKKAIKNGTKRVSNIGKKVVVYTKEDLDKALKKGKEEAKEAVEEVKEALKEEKKEVKKETKKAADEAK